MSAIRSAKGVRHGKFTHVLWPEPYRTSSVIYPTAGRRSSGQFTVAGEEEKLGQSFIASALAIAASAIIGAVSLGGIRAQQSLEPVSVIVFPGGFNWPIWVAQDKGYFASGGIEVNLTNTPNSVFSSRT